MEVIRGMIRRDSKVVGVVAAAVIISPVVGGAALFYSFRGVTSPEIQIVGAPRAPESLPPIPTLVGAPGERLRFTLTGVTVRGLWASDTGLRFSLGTQDFPITGPRAKGWDDSIKTSSRSDHEFEIGGSVVLPSTPVVARQTLQGTIRGDLDYPRASGERGFSDASTTLAVPVTVQVVPPAEAAAARAGERKGARVWAWIGFGVFAVALPVVIVIAREERRMKRAA